ncbi:MAG: AIR synthase related protein, partial [Anaerolineales bacterium]|nr:AIR synthase related protein [Anaerolineales bacterium]
MRYIVETHLRPEIASTHDAELLAEARALGVSGGDGIQSSKLYFLEGELSESDIEKLDVALFRESVCEISGWRRLGDEAARSSYSHAVEVRLRAGVTDNVAGQIMRSARQMDIPLLSAATGRRYVFSGFERADVETAVQQLLCNETVEDWAFGEIGPPLREQSPGPVSVEVIGIRERDGPSLAALSGERRLALDSAEMAAIQAYFLREGRDPTDAELETLAQTWSEHCVHKTFKARIIAQRENEPDKYAPIDGLLGSYLRAATETINAPWVRSAFVDNAGVIDFDDEFELSFKVETHNHPSAIEPFGGANTGVGGVVRDILGVSHVPIATTDVLCFGPADTALGSLPEGVLHPRRIASGVVAGIQDYGNKLGLPTVSGAIVYDSGYVANPLVYCGCVGIGRKGEHPRGPQHGDRVISIGGRTGRDGLRGATFSSMAMDAESGDVAGASVQIGDPLTEKGLIEVVREASAERLYTAVTDCGAGGYSSAVGEMAAGLGVSVDLVEVPTKYSGLAPWELWLSEAQERMVLAVPPGRLPRLREICARHDMELTNLGEFRADGYLRVFHDGAPVVNMELEFLHYGMPARELAAIIPVKPTGAFRVPPAYTDPKVILLALLSHPNIASTERIIRVYDHEVQGGTVVKPLLGASDDGASDACVLRPRGVKGWRGAALGCGINPNIGKVDAYAMAVSVVDEAVRNVVAVGADPERIVLLDNFCWGDPRKTERLGALVRAAQGCHEAALHHMAPFISGKDSLNNEYRDSLGESHSIPDTLLISALGIVPDVRRCVTMDLKQAGNIVYLLGETRAEFGGSH